MGERVRHRLSTEQFSAIARGEISPSLVADLRAAVISKHKLLIAAIGQALYAQSTEAWEDLRAAMQLLARADAHRPGTAAEALALPQVGAWAAQSLTRLDSDRPQLPDMHYLLSVAVASALRSGTHVDAWLPVQDGRVSLPNLGTVLPPDDVGKVRIRSDADGISFTCGSWGTADLVDLSARRAHWHPTPRLRVHAGGHLLNLTVEAHDPLLTQFITSAKVDRSDQWGNLYELFYEAWPLVVTNDPVRAGALVDGIGTLVPLVSSSSRPASVTSGWLPGAIALSVHPDALALAETLVHEFHHCVLGMLEDLVPLVDVDHAAVGYAPWRNDPRPIGGLIHGCYAHQAIAGFWRRQRGLVASLGDAFRADVNFDRWRRATPPVAEAILRSGALTPAGEVFVREMRAVLCEWRQDLVGDEATQAASKANTQHELRWRLIHIRPDPDLIDILVQDWLAGTSPRVKLDVDLSPDQPGSIVLSERYAPLQVDEAGGWWGSSPMLAEIEAWTELATARAQSGRVESTQLLRTRPEVIWALGQVLRERGASPDLDSLVAWLA